MSIQTGFQPKALFAKGSPFLAMTSELQAIRVRMDTIDKIEAPTSSLAKQFNVIAERTTKLENSVQSNSALINEVKTETTSFRETVTISIKSNTTKLHDVNTELASLKKTVEIQGRAIAKLTTLKTDLLQQNKEVKSDLTKQNQEVKADLIKQNKAINGEMNKLLELQKQQIGSFQASTQKVERNILEKTQMKIEENVNRDN